MELEKIGNNIRIARTIKGYSQEGLAKAIGKSQNWLQKVEKGELDISLTTLNELSKELNVQAEFLLFSSPSQIFNNCNLSGTFNNCVVNSESFLEKINKLIETIEKRL
ncbi:MAG: helix-turn-helix domain-containing protein [Bacteroidetes bacterium]|nr:helix-turn-helix domain-containing protein [Bacteroidota bacterium]